MRLVVASVVEKRFSVATTTSFAVVVVVVALGFPFVPVAVEVASKGAEALTPVKEEAPSLHRL